MADTDTDTDARWRVKVYSFNESMQWEDMGTGHVSMDYVERLQSLIIMVRSEEDGSMVLESKVFPDRPYQKQEETLIVWTEDEAMDIALSFQQKTGCDELWSKICDIQGRSTSVSPAQESPAQESSGETSDILEESSVFIELPPCELIKLEDILELVTTAVTSLPHREDLALAMERKAYIPKLLELFHICEDLENSNGLHNLYNIFRTLFLINNVSLLDVMFLEENIVSVVGCLEYDPGKSSPTRHRNYLAQVSTHREVVPFNNPRLLNKIHQTYQVMYIQEVILPTPSLFEENMMSALNSFVLFNKVDIINTIQEDHQFLGELFAQLHDEATPEEKYRELAHLLREVCNFALALKEEDRTKCYKKLSSYGFMSAVEGMLMYEDCNVVGTAVDILMSICEFHSFVLRDYILQDNDNQNEDNQFLNILISLLVDGEYTDIDVQVVGLIKVIIDPEAIMTESQSQTVEKSLFLNHFYKHCMHRLMAPLMAQTAGSEVSRDTPQNASLLSHILDILSLCVERHTYQIRHYIIDKNALARVLVLMTSVHGHLALAALRLCRRIVGLKDKFYNRYITRENLFAPIIKAFLANGRRYNLLNSATIELFEYLRSESINTLIAYVMENFWRELQAVEYVDTFRAMKLKYEQELDQEDEESTSAANSELLNAVTDTGRYRRDPRQLEEDEEAWFDEEEENTPSTDSLSSSSSSSSSSAIVDSLPLPPPPPPSFPNAIYSFPPPSTSLSTTTTLSESLSSSSSSSVTSIASSTPSLLPSPSPSLLPSPSPFTQASYSPRPTNALTRPPLTELAVKTPIVSQALKSLVDYDEDSDEEEKSEEQIESPAKRKKLADT